MVDKSEMIFGVRAVIEAIQAGKEIDKILVKKDIQSDLSKELFAALKGTLIPVQRVPVERINRITRKNHQGVIAFISSVTYQKTEDLVPFLFEEGKNPLFVMLDGVTDVRNFGAIARTCECAAVDAVIIPAKGSVTVNADAMKTSAGALHVLPVCREQNLKVTLQYLKDSGFRIVAATEKGDYDYTKADYTGPMCIIMGAEDKGVSYENLALCDEWVKIPMLGTIESLNVSVAAGILIYEAVKQITNKDMKKNLLFTLALCLLAQWSVAQAPKWVEKAKRAVFSVVTYDESDKILNTGNGFFVTEDGIALSDYSLFKGAQRAVVINSEGTQMPVEVIMGANDMYDVVKFRVAISGKKVPALVVAPVAPTVGASIYLLPYSTQKDRSYTTGQVKEESKVEGQYHYYTLDMQLKDKMVSCPVMTAEGQVFGLAQKSSGKDTATICYAVGADYAMAQKISPLSFNDHTLLSIGIKKALPETEEQALVYLYMASSQLAPEKYTELLNEFISQYPNSADGYLRRANNQIFQSKEASSMDKVAADMDKALEVAQKKDDAYFNRAKLIYGYQLDKPEKTYKDWTYDRALDEVRKAIAIEALPVYVQLEGDIQFAKKDYAAALASYEKVNDSNIASPATFFSAAKTKELMEAAPEEVLALMDSCMARFVQPYSEEAAPYLLERAQMRLNAGQGRGAMLDYDEYYKAVRGNVNDVFYYYREQAAVQAKQFQRALDDLAKAIELNPKELTYFSELAVVNIRVGRNEEAIKVLKDALEIDSKYAEAYRLIGVAQLQLKQNKEACASFAKAKELGDPNVDALIEKHCK